MVNERDDEEKEPKEHLAEWIVRIIEDNDRAGKPARDAMRAIVYALVSVVNENGGPAQIRTLKRELQKIARDLPPVGK
jgi:hypothetical protein